MPSLDPPLLSRRPALRGRLFAGLRRLACADPELVDWARTSGFEVVYTGKGASYLEHYHAMNPDNVWENWEFSKELTDSVQLNPYMHVYYKRVIRHNYGRLSGGIPSIVDCSRFIVTNRGECYQR